MQVQTQPGYVLHTRPYRDSSLLVDVLSRDFGRVSLIARGQRQTRQKGRRPLQPFVPLLISWRGRTDLKTLTAAENSAAGVFLGGHHLYSGLYANELLVRLLPQGDAYPEVFAIYQQLLMQLAAAAPLEATLRSFEFSLLDELGYGIELNVEATTGEPIQEGRVYAYAAELGFVALASNDPQAASGFLGEDLLAIAAADYRLPETLRAAKRLSRLVLAAHLGNRPLKSRELFRPGG